MITIIHGDDIQKSLAHLNFLTQKLSNAVKFEGKTVKLDDIELAFESTGLFDEKKKFIVLYLSRFLRETLALFIEKANNSKYQIFIWDDKKIDLRLLKKFKNPKVFEFLLPKYYFEYLEALIPHNSKTAVKLLQNLSKQFSNEQIFYSSVKRIRQLLMAKHGSQNFEELSKMGSWQLSKIENQAKAWEESKLKKFYAKLFELEVFLKSSNLSLSLVKHIDILLLNELQ